MKKEKDELIAALDAIIRDDSVLYVFLVVNKDGGDIVMRANINEENGLSIKRNLIDAYTKKKEKLNGVDGDVFNIDTAVDANDGVLWYNLEDRPSTFNHLLEVKNHHVHEDDYFDVGRGHYFIDKNDLQNIKGFIFEIGRPEIGRTYIYRKKYNVDLFRRARGFRFRDGKFTLFDEDLLTIDGKIDYLLLDDEFYVFNNSVLESYDDVKVVVKNTARESVQAIDDIELVVDSGHLNERIESDFSFARKMISAIKASPVKDIEKSKILKFIDKQKDLKVIFDIQDGKIDLSSKKAQDAFVKLMNDDYLRSTLSGKKYEALKKKKRKST